MKIGIPLRYDVVERKNTFYITSNYYDILENNGCEIKPLLPPKEIIRSEEEHPDRRYQDYLDDSDRTYIEESIKDVSGVILPGGRVITDFDKYLVELCIKRNIPLLGICMGLQVICNYNIDGVKLLPVEGHSQEGPDSELLHDVNIDKESILYKIIGKGRIKVNSFHRFMVIEKDFFNVIARSDDNTIEGVVIPGTKVLGIQWHPEISYPFDEPSKKIMHAFIEECKNSSFEPNDQEYNIKFDKYKSEVIDNVYKYYITEDERKDYIKKYKDC